MGPPKTPLLTTDCVIFDGAARVLLIRRKNEPFKRAYALPGGFIDVGETTEAACRREVLEEAGIVVDRLVLVGVYSDPGRDPRGHTVSVAYMTRFDRAPRTESWFRRGSGRMGQGLEDKKAGLRSCHDHRRCRKTAQSMMWQRTIIKAIDARHQSYR